MSDALIPVVEAVQSDPTITFGPVYWNVWNQDQGTALSSSVLIGSYNMLAVFVIMRNTSDVYDIHLGFRITPGGSPVYSSATYNAAISSVQYGTRYIQLRSATITIPGGVSYNGSILSLGMGMYGLLAIFIVPVKWS